VLEFTITIPRHQLRPRYGQGFHGAPLVMPQEGADAAAQIDQPARPGSPRVV
jgi:hypothetical protein